MFARRKKKIQATTTDIAAASLVTVGALNWGLVGLFGFDLVAALLGRNSRLSRLVYTAVGASAVYLALTSDQG